MAALPRGPLVLHEQNSVAGLANRVLARVADRSMSAFPDALAKAEWTGNPVRADIAALAAPAERYAGRRSGPVRSACWWWAAASGGAQALNECVPRALALPRRSGPGRAPDRREKNLDGARGGLRRGRRAGRVRALHRRHGAAATPRPIWSICRAGATDRGRAGGGRRGERAGAVPVRGGRPPDAQRALPGRRRARRSCCRRRELTPRAAGRTAARARRASSCWRWRARRARWASPMRRAWSPSAAWSSRGMKHKVKHIHFVGIGGAGMSGIAEVLLNLGYEVSGSDLAESAATRRLKELGAQSRARPRRGKRRRRRRGGDVDRRATRTTPKSMAARARRDPGGAARDDAGGADAAASRASRSPARTARPPPPAWWRACWPRAGSIRLS